MSSFTRRFRRVRAAVWTLVVFVVYSFAVGPAIPPENPLSEKISAREIDFDGVADSRDASDSDGSTDSAERSGDAESPWIRVVYDDGVATRLETSIVRFEGTRREADGSSRPIEIDLIGAIHVAEKEYYDALNDAFREYDAVVFEMVAPRGTDVKKLAAAEREAKARGFDGSPLNAFPFLQEALGRSLGLAYQIDGIDYAADNLRRGDATTEEFLIEILANGDVQAFLTNAFFDALLDHTAGDVEGAALAILLAKNKRTTARRFVAGNLAVDELGSDDGSGDAANERENALIHFRNRKALDAIRAELASGKSKIGVFYGAAHLPDLRRRLETEFGTKRVGEPRWLPAWRMERGE